MSGEIRAAAERQAKGAGPHDTDAFFQLEEDALLLARAWLAEHPPSPAAPPAGPPPAADKAGEQSDADRKAAHEYAASQCAIGYGVGRVRRAIEAAFLAGLAHGGPRLAALEAACRAAEDALVVAKQQLEFRAGRRQRGWDQAFVFERINTALVALALGAAGPGGG